MSEGETNGSIIPAAGGVGWNEGWDMVWVLYYTMHCAADMGVEIKERSERKEK